MIRTILVTLISLLVVSAAVAADTDITTYDNVIYAETVTVEANKEVTLSIQARTTFNLRSYQFKMHLPEGVSFVVDSDGLPVSEISSNRTYSKKMNYRAEILSDGDLMVLCSSILGGNYQGLTGEICTVRLRIDQEAYGNLPIQLYLVKACDPQYQAYTLPTVTFSVNVDKGLLGDVNADGSVSISDIVHFIQIQNQPTQSTGYQRWRADIDDDGSLTDDDLLTIRTILLQ